MKEFQSAYIKVAKITLRKYGLEEAVSGLESGKSYLNNFRYENFYKQG